MATLTESKKSLMDLWRGQGMDAALLKAFEAVPREAFVPTELTNQAYIDQPLHIGHEQTISQPTTVMNMLALLDVSPKMSVLEVGAGSGYVCALLAALGCQVTGVEIIPELSVPAAKTIHKLGYGDGVNIHAGDGSMGWQDGAPYDRILLSAASPSVPRQLLDQLKDGGVMVAPVGTVEQRMIVLKKRGNEIVEEDHGAYVFVPLTGKFGEEESGDDLPNMPFA